MHDSPFYILISMLDLYSYARHFICLARHISINENCPYQGVVLLPVPEDMRTFFNVTHVLLYFICSRLLPI